MKISSMVRLISMAFAILTVVMIVSLFGLYNSFMNYQDSTARQTRFKQLGLDLSAASDLLTSNAQHYVVTGDKVYYDDYMKEVDVTKTRPRVVEELKTLGAPQDELDLVEKAAGLSNTLAELESMAFDKVAEGDFEAARDLIFGKDYAAGKIPIIQTMNEFQSAMNNRAQSESQDAANMANTMVILLGIIIFTQALIILASLFLLARKIKPIGALVAASIQISEGNLNVNIACNSNDEIGDLAKSFSKFVASLNMLIDEMNSMSKEQDDGNFDYYMNPGDLKGSYKTVVDGINNMVSEYVTLISEVLVCLQGFEQGDFNQKITSYNENKALEYKTMLAIDGLHNSLSQINAQIQSQIQSVLEGNLSDRADAGKCKGDWAVIINNLNHLVEVIEAPIHEAADVLQDVSAGNFSRKMQGEYQGDFLIIKDSINSMVLNIASYINEISSVLNELADNNLDLEITGEYVGDFASIKVSLNNIIMKLNNVMEEINSASEQVAAGSKQLSQSSMTLAQGASEQASYIEKLSSTVLSVNDQTQKNADNAKKASTLSNNSNENASMGNNEMEKMLNAMEDIKKESNNISQIIKTIDDIAFQTNLLALNAAVEAARAGTSGKGFSVVAEEVRNLAGKSKIAAQETAVMIENTINKVDEGTTIAKETAKALNKIVNSITEVSGIVDEISEASDAQADALTQINQGVQQITEVVQTNSATSEESAAASQELTGQSDVLKNMIQVFKLKKTIK